MDIDLSDLPRQINRAIAENPALSKSGLAKAMKVSNSAVTGLLNGTRSIRADEIAPIMNYLGWDTPTESHSARPSGRLILEVDVRAGLGGGGSLVGREVIRNGEYADPVKDEPWSFPSRFVREELRTTESRVIILETQGDSMYPTIGSGDRVIVDTGHRVPSPDGIYAIRDRYDGIQVKRLQVLRRGDPPRILIISDNNAHQDEEVGADEIAIVGRVLWGLKRL